jgi:hypothetical protein
MHIHTYIHVSDIVINIICLVDAIPPFRLVVHLYWCPAVCSLYIHTRLAFTFALETTDVLTLHMAYLRYHTHIMMEPGVLTRSSLDGI